MNSKLTPLEYYQKEIASGEFFSDLAQLRVLNHMQEVHKELVNEENQRNSILKFFRKKQTIKGLYVWGGVGIGKTFLMDCFFYTLPFKYKLREHFHLFMQRIHHQLRKHQGKKDPLDIIAKDLANQFIVICFDEFFVSDITDAMLLGKLFKYLFSYGVTLIATSNVAPDDIYKYGLQRSQFLPAIKLLKKQTTVLHMASTTDYRLRHLQAAGVFYSPLDEKAKDNMQKSFDTLTQGLAKSFEPIVINDRPIKIINSAGSTVWFEFLDICSVPRSQLDYLEISKIYKTVLISNIPLIKENEKDKITLFINLIDVLYDAKVRFIASAAEPVDQLYRRGYMIMEYARTHSRLLEMQSEDYFSRDDE